MTNGENFSKVFSVKQVDEEGEYVYVKVPNYSGSLKFPLDWWNDTYRSLYDHIKYERDNAIESLNYTKKQLNEVRTEKNNITEQLNEVKTEKDRAIEKLRELGYEFDEE